MAQQRNHKASILSALNSFPSDNASVEAAWRQALLLRELARDERVVARKRRADAESARAQAEHEAITATKQLCAELQAQARMKLQQAEDSLAEADRIRSDAQSKADRLIEQAKVQYDAAANARVEAEKYAEEVQANARSAADALMEQTRSGSEELASRMRRETAEDIRKILTEIEMARAAAEDELETQRILTETARVRAFSHGLAAESADVEMAQKNPRPEPLILDLAKPQYASKPAASAPSVSQPAVKRKASRRRKSSSPKITPLVAKVPVKGQAPKKPAALKVVKARSRKAA